jgi:hypothetical protein
MVHVPSTEQLLYQISRDDTVALSALSSLTERLAEEGGPTTADVALLMTLSVTAQDNRRKRAHGLLPGDFAPLTDRQMELVRRLLRRHSGTLLQIAADRAAKRAQTAAGGQANARAA